VTAFSISTLLAGTMGAIPLAAHTIALNVASFTFMVPFGIAQAAAVLVGQALGRQDPVGARESGWCAIFMGATFMFGSGLALYFGADEILRIFTQDEGTIAIGRSIFTLAAVFQIADGMQTVASGALRGAKDTRSGMLAMLAGYWITALPSGCVFAFAIGKGVLGLWTGFCVGLWSVATLLLARWRVVARSL
jgi:MATE family multidrug resistance protein